MQRDYFDFDIAFNLLDKSKSYDFKIIYELDDDLMHMDESNPGYGYYMGIKDKLESIISRADLVTVTTDNLKNQIYYLNSNIHVIPNRLIPDWFNYNNEKLRNENTIKLDIWGLFSIYGI